MYKLLLFTFLAFAGKGFAQCTLPVMLESNGNCLGAQLTVNTSANISKIIWYSGNTPVDSVISSSYTSTLIAGGNGQGSAANQFDFPNGIYRDVSGNTYVSDAGNNRVQKFAPGSNIGVTVAGGNGGGSAANQLAFPRGIYVDVNGDIYVVDELNNRIQKWAAGATTGATVAGGNGAGAAANQFDGPFGLWVDAAGNIFVADQANNRVQKWSPGATSGVTIAGGNGPGSAANQLNGPMAPSLDAAGNIYVADKNNHRVQKWAPGATNGITVAGGNGPGSAASQLYGPVGVFVTAGGDVYVADYLNDRIQLWHPGAVSGITVASSNFPNQTGAVFTRPTCLFVDTNGNVYVGVAGSASVQEWGQIQSPVNTTYTPLTPEVFIAVVTDDNNCTVTTNGILINPVETPFVSISTSFTTVSYCSQVTFTATPSGGGQNPFYKWQVNGTDAGINNAVFTANNLADGSAINCMMTTSAVCASSPTAISNSITITITPLPVTLKTKNGYCTGDTLVVSTADPISKIIWYNGSTAADSSSRNNLAGGGVTVAGGYGSGTNANQFDYPEAIFPGANGDIYVADAANDRIQKWVPGATSGVTVAGGNGRGNAANQFYQPAEVFLDAAGNLFVSDQYNNRIQKFAPGLTAGTTVAGGNGQGAGANQLFNPIGLFTNAAGNIYIADFRNERVQKWAPGATSGITVAGGNGAGPAANQLDGPGAVFVDATGNLYIADINNHRIQKWAPGASTGVTVAGGNGPGGAPNQLYYPTDVVVDAGGDVYVADINNNRIQKWLPGATIGVTVAGGNGLGSGANQFYNPVSIYLDDSNHIYVADLNNSRIQKWPLVAAIDTTYKALSPGTYTAVVLTSGGCTLTSNPVVINSAENPAVTITASATSICKGEAVKFHATVINVGINPLYQWQVNGINMGTGDSLFTNSSLQDAAVVRCIITSNAPCASAPVDTSNSIKLTVGNPVTPSVTIAASQNNICPGTAIIFSAIPVNMGNNPAYQWHVNGINAGTNNTIFISSSLANGDVITCMLTSNAACVTSTTASSNTISVTVNSSTPEVIISPSATGVCSGTPVTFTAAVTNATGSFVYQWLVNAVQSGSNSSSYTGSSFMNGDSVQCVVTTTGACKVAYSNLMAVLISPALVIASHTVSITQGQSIVLDPVVAGNAVKYLWSPATYLSDAAIRTPLANPLQTTAYQLMVTSANGCTGKGIITVNVFSLLAVPTAFSPNNDGRNDIFYMLGRQLGTTIKTFSVFNEWGQLVFYNQNVLTNEPGAGWNGYIKEKQAAIGTYVYFIELQLANGAEKIVKGTVTLIR